MNVKQMAVKKAKAQEKALKIRQELWPNLNQSDLWNRVVQKGFTTVPRTMSVIMRIMDSLSKGMPLSSTYFVLWCHVYDDSMVIIDNPLVYAAEAGFSGERALTTWRSRMDILQEFGFIECKEGSTGKHHYVLIKNPHKVIKKIKDKIQSKLFTQLFDRTLDVGAIDFHENQ